MRILSLIFLMLSPLLAGAAGGHGEAASPAGIPWETIIKQTFNLVLLFGVLTYFMRNGVKAYFAERQRVYLEMVQKADFAKREAEKNKADIAKRLKELEANSAQALRQATTDADDLKKRILAEAKEVSEKFKAEVERTTALEIEKAKTELRRELLNSSVKMAHQSLKETVGGAEQKKLQREFVDKIQAVR